MLTKLYPKLDTHIKIKNNKMSVSQPTNKPSKYHLPLTNDNIILANLVDNVNKNNLHIFYQQDDSIFKQKIDKLNLKFYLETEKYLTNQHNENKCQNSLFIILFQQISLYIGEIERLNLILQEKKGDPKFIKERVNEYIRKQKDFETKEKLIKTLKDSKNNLEKKLAMLILQEDKIKSENASLKRQNKFYIEQLQMFLTKDNDQPIIENTNNNKIIELNSLNSKNIRDLEIETNISMSITTKISKKRNLSDNNFINICENQYKNTSKTHGLTSNTGNIINNSNNTIQSSNYEVNLFRIGNNKYSNNSNVSNGTSTKPTSFESNIKLSVTQFNSSSPSRLNPICFISKGKKECKIIKPEKEQLTRTASEDSSNSHYSANPIINLLPLRCHSPNVLMSKEKIKTYIQKCDKELKELNSIEIYLKKMKYEIKNKNFEQTNRTGDCLIKAEIINNNEQFIDCLMMNETCEEQPQHIKTEVMVSDLEDYDNVRMKSNGFVKKNTLNNMVSSQMNLVTIDLENQNLLNSKNNNINFGHNVKLKQPKIFNISMRTNFDGNNNINNANKNNGLSAIKIKGLQNKKINNE